MSDVLQAPAPLVRVPSGIVGLDTILHGGLLQGGIYLISGKPGTGKTILGNQLCFHHITAGGRAVFVTLLAENHTRMFAHLQSLRFFDMSRISDTVYYFSGYSTLEKDGLDGLLKLLRQVIRDHHATLLVIDGLAAAVGVESDVSFKRFVQNLQVATQMSHCITVLLAHAHSGAVNVDYTMMDGVVELDHRLIGARAVRELYLPKFRGSDYLTGQHSFTITADGISVYPRIEALYAQPQTMNHAPVVLADVGIATLNAMLNGGIPEGSTTLVMGAPGTGKTLLGLHFLAAGAPQKQPGLYFGFNELPPRLLRKADGVGLAVRELVAQGVLDVVWHPPTGQVLDALGERLLSVVARRNVRRAFIDGLAGFQVASVYPERFKEFFAALANELRAREVTTVMSIELPDLISPSVRVPLESVSTGVDNTILLRHLELQSQLYRLISIVNVRELAYDTSIREFKITDHGIEVAATFESAEAILTGVARPRAPTPPVARRRARGSDVEGKDANNPGR